MRRVAHLEPPQVRPRLVMSWLKNLNSTGIVFGIKLLERATQVFF